NIIGRTYGIIADNVLVLNPLQDLPAVTSLWNVVRNVVNAMSVLLLVAAGIAIMFRYDPKTFSLQSVLTKLLTTILLVNFSILIIQFVVDVSNVIAYGGYYLLQSVAEGSGATGRGAGGALTALAIG